MVTCELRDMCPIQAEGRGRPNQEAGMCKLLTDLDLLNGMTGNASHSANDDHLVGILASPLASSLCANASRQQCTVAGISVKQQQQPPQQEHDALLQPLSRPCQLP